MVSKRAPKDGSALRRAIVAGAVLTAVLAAALCAPSVVFAATAGVTGLASPTHPTGQWVSSPDAAFAWSPAIDWAPRQVGFYDTPGSYRDNPVAVELSGTTAYVADGSNGLHIISVSNPASPVLLGTTGASLDARDVAISGTTAYVATAGGLRIVSVANPAAPVLGASVSLSGAPERVVVSGTRAYVASYGYGLEIVDVSNPAVPVRLGGYSTGLPGASDVAVSGTTAYVAEETSGLHIVDVTTPTAPALLGKYVSPNKGYGVAVSGSTAYLATYEDGLHIVDVTTPTAPALLGSQATSGTAFCVAVSGTTAYVTDYAAGLNLIDVTTPTAPTLLGAASLPGNSRGVAVAGNIACIASGGYGLRVLDVTTAKSGPPPIEYSYELSKSSGTTPDTISDGAATSTVLTGIADGSWYFHVRALMNGVASTTSHLLIRVDTKAPTTSDNALDSYANTASFTLTAADSLSGVEHTEWRVGSGGWTTGTKVKVTTLGTYVVQYRSADVAGNTETTKSTKVTVYSDRSYRVSRVSDTDRYTTAVKTARKGFDPVSNGTWPGVTHVIIACGEDRALADPLASAGLVWAYDAPLFLVNSRFVPGQVTTALKQISAACGTTVVVHVVGGKLSVPDVRLAEIDAAVSGPLKFDRLISGGNRFDVAEKIANRVAAEWESRNGTGTAPTRVLVANGADSDTFFDALALSPIAANEGFPILLVSRYVVPAATTRAIKTIGPKEVIVGGGAATVSNNVAITLGASRWWGGDRYTTAITIADNAVSRGWLDRRVVGVSAKLPDALAGGGVVGKFGGVSVITAGPSLTSSTGSWLKRHEAEMDNCYIFGGTVSVTPKTESQIKAALR